MAISTQIQNLNLIPGKSAPVVVHLSQGNVGNTVQFYLYDGDNPYYPTNVSIAVHGVRADGSVFGPYAVSTTSGNNLVSFNIVSAMTSVNGAAIGELVLTDSNQNQIGSANFGMLVEATPYSSSVTYEDDLSIYQRILAYVKSSSALIEEKINTKSSQLDEKINTEISRATNSETILGTRIDQIIAPSGEAPSAAEITDARISYNGVVYDSLGTAIRRQITDLKSAFDEDRSKIFAETGSIYKTEISVTQNRAIDATTKQITADIASGNEYTVLFTDPNGCFTETISFYAFKEDGTRSWVGSAHSNTALTKTADYNIKGFSIYYQKPAATGIVEMKVTSNVEEHPNSIEAKVNALAENRVLYKNASVALSGSGQFVTKDIDVPVNETGVYYNVTVGSVENVSPVKPVRFRFLDSAGTVIEPDRYIAVGIVGTLVSPSNAAKLRLTLYATTSGGLTGNAYFNNVAIWVGSPADIDLVVSEDIFAKRLTVEGHAFLPDNPLIPSFAHKGYAFTAPECTGAAMVEAKRRGFTGVENDTQLTSDGQIVMWHDSKLSKIGDSSHGVGDYTLAQLKAMDFGSWKASKYANERILTFSEWVLLCKNLGLKINVDTKFEWTAEQAASLAQTVIDYGMTDNCVWNINFNGGYTTKLVELIPKANLNYIGTATAERCAILQSFMSEHPSISVQLTPELSELTAEDVARAHSFGIKQFFYTAIDLTSVNLENYKTYMQSALTFGVDGGVTDIYRIVDIANMELL